MSARLAVDLAKSFGLTPLELARIAPLEEASRLSGLSEDTLRREHSDKFVRLSERRVGMRVGHALMLTADTSAESTAAANL